jgi:hypothetical protein
VAHGSLSTGAQLRYLWSSVAYCFACLGGVLLLLLLLQAPQLTLA